MYSVDHWHLVREATEFKPRAWRTKVGQKNYSAEANINKGSSTTLLALCHNMWLGLLSCQVFIACFSKWMQQHIFFRWTPLPNNWKIVGGVIFLTSNNMNHLALCFQLTILFLPLYCFFFSFSFLKCFIFIQSYSLKLWKKKICQARRNISGELNPVYSVVKPNQLSYSMTTILLFSVYTKQIWKLIILTFILFRTI